MSKNHTEKRNSKKIFELVESETRKGTPILDKLGKDLTKYAEDGKLEPVIGREKEIEQVIWILSRKNKNNPVIIGEAGVGKTAIVEGIAQMMVSQNCPESLSGKRIIYLDMGSIMSGTGGQGDLETKAKLILKELEENPNIILFMDEIHMIVNPNMPIDFANLIKPALARGEMRCIGATTNNEFRNSIEKDAALERRFQKITVEQPSIQDTITILNKIKGKYEEFHKVKYTDDAIVACVKLADRYITYRFFPDKAIDLLDEVGAKARITKKDTPPEIAEAERELQAVRKEKQKYMSTNDYDGAAKTRVKEKELIDKVIKLKAKYSNENRITITRDGVENVISIKTGIPVEKLSQEESAKLLNLEKDLKMVIVGQDDAVTKIAKCIRRNRAGLKDPKRPGGVFLFLGSTGIGKTHTVKMLAKNVFGSEDDLIRVDMSEYAERHQAARFIGSPPGYVGYGEGGQLTEKVRRKPNSIILFDEIEKAHRDVLNYFLQIFDEGTLTDGQGRKVDFKNTIIVMTSNVGATAVRDMKTPVGFGMQQPAAKEEASKDIILKELHRQFAPEFINRIDDIIIFKPLAKENIYKIIDVEIKKLSDKLTDLGYTLTITNNVKDLLIEKGYDESMGARPLKRAIQNYLEDPISDEILKKNIKDVINIDYDPKTKKLSINGNIIEESKKFLITKFKKFNS